MIDRLFELTAGEEGFIVTMRCENRFDEVQYAEIRTLLSGLVTEWKNENNIPKKAVLALIELTECLVGGSRFLTESDALRTEDAAIEIKDIINDLYETL